MAKGLLHPGLMVIRRVGWVGGVEKWLVVGEIWIVIGEGEGERK